MNVLAQEITDRFSIFNGDCVEVVRGLPSDSIGYTITSTPFESLYTYSASSRDFGNCVDGAQFSEHMDFLIPELLRVTKPGRLLSLHCMLLPTSKSRDGYIGLRDFRGDLIRAFQRHGFIFHSEVCIWKDPVTAMQRTHALGLLHKQLRKDSTMSRQGVPDYLVTMRKPGVNPDPVMHKTEDDDGKDEGEPYPVGLWQRVASPVWVTLRDDGQRVILPEPSIFEYDDEDEYRAAKAARIKAQEAYNTCIDPNFKLCTGEVDDDNDGTINPTDTLTKIMSKTARKSAREHNDERHICPLQLEVIRRAMRLWTRPDDVVLSPFAGIGSEGYVALQEGRRFVGCELKGTYFKQAVRNLHAAQRSQGKQTTLAL